MSFSVITGDLQARLKSNLPQVRILLKRNPAIAYSRITEIGRDAGRRYGIDLIVNFPHEGKIDEFDMYGRRDLSIILDRTKTRFPIGRDTIKQKAREVLGDVRAEDAYMYEGKERGSRSSSRRKDRHTAPFDTHMVRVYRPRDGVLQLG